MNPNLQVSSGFKELLLKKLSYAVICSVAFHLLGVFFYVIAVNFNAHLSEWFKGVFNTLTSFSTWLHLVPFASIIFAQIVICAKDYVFKGTYRFSRFQKFIAIFSARTFLLGVLHVTVGGLAVWLYLSLSGGQHQDLYVECKDKFYCLEEGSFFMILNGLWIGFYFFIQMYVADRSLIFPVAQQRKLLHFKAKFVPILKESKAAAFYPTLYYFVLYYICGSYLRSSFASLFKLRLQNEGFSFWLYGYTWIFTILYILNMKLMQFFFELFLTEPIEHPVMSTYDNDTPLSEALLLNNMPIVQHLACLDLYLLSIWSFQRRQALFTLSQPGGHPHTWNRLIEGALKVITQFTDCLNKSADILLEKEEKNRYTSKTEVLSTPILSLQSPLNRSLNFENMRNLSVVQPGSPVSQVISPQQQQVKVSISNLILEIAIAKLIIIHQHFSESIQNFRSVKYVFGELPEAHIQHSLKNGQLIVWTTQGLTNVAVASFTEDPYGIIQKDLPVLITSLVALKQSVEKLNKLTVFSRKGPGFDEFSFKMKNSVNSAVKRSLCNICRTFGKYLSDIPLTRDIASQLECYI